MAEISTAVSMARVPILGENGRISNDYIPESIPEAERVAQEAASRAKSAATAAEGSASAAGTSATQASSSASAASTSATKAQQSAEAAGGSATSAKSAQTAAETAKTAAEKAKADAAASAQSAQQSASAAATSASSVADKFISSAQATTLEPGSQATASVENQVLTIGVPEGQKGDTPTVGIGTVETLPAGSSATATTTSTDTGVNINLGIPKGDPGDVSAVQTAEGSDLSVSTAEGTVTIDDSALRERIAELENQAANVVTGTSTGYVAHGEDAYAQKPREVRIKGKTWVNRWPVINNTANGITVATDGTGLVTVTGTATADADITADVSGWAAGRNYTAMISATPTGCSAYFEVQKPSGNTSINASTSGATLNVASDATVCIAGVRVMGGTTVNASFRVMLVDGTEAPDCFTPCASITSVQPGKLVTAGKNLLKFRDDLQQVTRNGITFTPNEDGTVTVNGTATANDTDYYIVGNGCASRADACLPASDLVFSTNGAAKLYGYDSSGVPVISSVINNGQSQIAASKAQACAEMVVYLSYASGHGESNKRVYVQLELGSTATDYEPPNITTTPINLDGNTLCSLPDGTHDELTIDATGAVTLTKRTQTVQLDGDGTWIWNETPYVHYISLWSYYGGLPSGYSSDRHFVDKLPASSEVANGLYSANENGSAAYLREPTFASDAAGVKEWMSTNKPIAILPLLEPQTISLPPVTLPALPAPTFNQYHDSPVPSDTSTEYARDINLVLDKLAKQIAGTASAVAVREASTIEEE